MQCICHILFSKYLLNYMGNSVCDVMTRWRLEIITGNIQQSRCVETNYNEMVTIKTTRHSSMYYVCCFTTCLNQVPLLCDY